MRCYINEGFRQVPAQKKRGRCYIPVRRYLAETWANGCSEPSTHNVNVHHYPILPVLSTAKFLEHSNNQQTLIFIPQKWVHTFAKEAYPTANIEIIRETPHRQDKENVSNRCFLAKLRANKCMQRLSR